LKLKPNCECCDKDLPVESREAMICTFECTFCRDSVETKLNFVCPNCGGDFTARPVRPSNRLAEYPASTERFYKPEGCAGSASRFNWKLIRNSSKINCPNI
ncbi:MAG TPA: DUF1272 domain-containing protein, partial [Pyrinomonadaceae bacterium]